jgi:3,4-dihydroxy-9,10-secoandrosta-1,3,5(10)-triene-9,17-dione 4,5-dioxygenase
MIDTRALGYVVIESTDLAKWQHFATEVLGMMVAPSIREDGVLYIKMDEYNYRFRIVQSQRDCFSVAGWELAGEREFASAMEQLRTAGIAFERASPAVAATRQVRDLLSFTAPGGLRCELFYYMKLDYLPLISAVGVQRFVTGYHGSMGLGHIAAATPDLAASHAFFTGVMGFGQTDYMHLHFAPDPADPGQGLHFLHCNNPRHHSLALFQDANPHPGDLVHLMVEVEDIDTLGRMMDRVHSNGVRVITNLGRHTNDRMVSLYVETPAGFALEYGFDGVQVDWSTYTPTDSMRTSHWGHRWGQG